MGSDLDNHIAAGGEFSSALGGLMAEGIFALGRLSLNSLEEWGNKIKAQIEDEEAEEEEAEEYRRASREQQWKDLLKEHIRLRDEREYYFLERISNLEKSYKKEKEQGKVLSEKIATLENSYKKEKEQGKVLLEKIATLENRLKKEEEATKKERTSFETEQKTTNLLHLDKSNLLLSGMAFAMMSVEYAQKTGLIHQKITEEDVLKLFVDWTKKRFEVGKWSDNTVTPFLQAYRVSIESILFRMRNTAKVDGKNDIAYVVDSKKSAVKIPEDFLWILSKKTLELIVEFEVETDGVRKDGPSMIKDSSFLRNEKTGKHLVKSDFCVRNESKEPLAGEMRDRKTNNERLVKNKLYGFLESRQKRVGEEKKTSGSGMNNS